MRKDNPVRQEHKDPLEKQDHWVPKEMLVRKDKPEKQDQWVPREMLVHKDNPVRQEPKDLPERQDQ